MQSRKRCGTVNSFSTIRLIQRHRAAWADHSKDTTGEQVRTEEAAVLDNMTDGGDESSIQTLNFTKNTRSDTAKHPQDWVDKMGGA